MMKIFFILLLFFTIKCGWAQTNHITHLYSWMNCSFIHSNGAIEIKPFKGFIMIDDKKKECSIPQLNIKFKFDRQEPLNGYTMYLNNNYGQLIISNDLFMAEFEYYTGIGGHYELTNIKEVTDHD